MIKNVEIGATYFAGNTFNPEEKTVLALVDWASVPAREQTAWQVICYWEKMAESGEQWVKYRSSHTRKVQYMRADTFKGVTHVSHDAMVESYVASRASLRTYVG